MEERRNSHGGEVGSAEQPSRKSDTVKLRERRRRFLAVSRGLAESPVSR